MGIYAAYCQCLTYIGIDPNSSVAGLVQTIGNRNQLPAALSFHPMTNKNAQIYKPGLFCSREEPGFLSVCGAPGV